MLHRALAALAAVFWLASCAPAVDWREMRATDAPLQMSMPCRPASHQRQVRIAGDARTMTMQACAMDAGTFALAHFVVNDPGQVGMALEELVASARANVQGQVAWSGPAVVPGMTPHAAALQWRIEGRLPDGKAVVLHGLAFSYGARVFQASVIGERPEDSLVRTFFGSLVVRP